MAEYITELFDDKLSGIPLLAWQKFLGIFTEKQTPENLVAGLDRLAAAYAVPGATAEQSALIRNKMKELGTLISE